MAIFAKLSSGNWRAQVRRKGRYVSESFRRRKDAEEWALDIERRIDLGEATNALRRDRAKTLAAILDLRFSDMIEVGRSPRRSRAAVLTALRAELGGVCLHELTRARLVDFGKTRARAGAGPAALAIDFSLLRTVLTHAAAVHGIDVSAENVRLARVALHRLGLIGKADERPRPRVQEWWRPHVARFEKQHVWPVT